MSGRTAVLGLIASLWVPACSATAEPAYLASPITRWQIAEGSRNESPRAPGAIDPPPSDGAPSLQERQLGLRWRFRAGSPSPGIAVAPDGTVYVPTHEGHVHAVAADGQFQWSFNCHAPATGVAVNARGLLLVGTNDGVLHAILAGGTGLWAYQAPFPLRTRLAVGGDGTAFVGDASDHLVAVSPFGGARWRAPIEGGIVAGPVVLPDGSVLVGTAAGELLWVDGVLKRRRVALPGVVVQDPEMLSDGTVMVVTESALVVVRDGIEAWHVDGVEAAAGAEDECVTIGGDGLCRRALDGTARGCAPFPRSPSARPVVGPRGQVFVPTRAGELVIVAPTGQIERVVQVARTALLEPVVDASHGQVLVGAGDGVVGAVALEATGDD